MVSIRSFLTTVASLAAIVQNVSAHAAHRNPLNYVSILEKPVLSTPSRRVHHHTKFEITFSLHDGQQDVRLSLEPNLDILPDSFHVNYLGPDGSLQESELVERHQHKIYRGTAFIRREGRSEWARAGWARIAIHRDGKHPVFEGAFRVDGNQHHIQTASHYRRLRHPEDPEVTLTQDADETMVVWRDSDLKEFYDDPLDTKRDVRGRRACSSNDLSFNENYDPWANVKPVSAAVSPKSLFGRQIDPGSTGDDGGSMDLSSTIGSTQGCPNTRRIALVGIATDCTYTSEFNSTQSVRSNIISMVNSASEVYESSFNISLGIQNLTISRAECPGSSSNPAPWNVDCSPSVSISDRLNLFSRWRGDIDDDNAFWTLLSTCNTDNAVGLAWLGQACISGAQSTDGRDGGTETVSSANVVIRTDSEWQVFAHEAGHTFGAVHDCDEAECSGGGRMRRCCPLTSDTCDARSQFIMNPSTGRQINDFSPCSVGNVCSALFRNAVRSDCLANNRNVQTITESQCGNGIVETGEDCDCGTAEDCGDNPCCNPETCTFTDNSVCDPSNEDCCTNECRFASEGTVCRESTGLCDPEETCPGGSSVCPRDEHLDDGDSCGDGDDLRCASGQCTSRDQQCQSAVGPQDTNNETEACGNECRILCRSPTLFGTDSCRSYPQNYLDGTPCSNGGMCRNGACRGASFAQQAGDFWQRNSHILIPVVASVGGLIALCILWCCISSCCKRRRAKKVSKLPPSPPPAAQVSGGNGAPGGWQGYGGAWGSSVPPPPAQYANQGYGNQQSHHRSEDHQAHQSPPQQQYQAPEYQPPEYQPYSGQQTSYPGQWTPQRNQRSLSMRYA